MKSEEFAELLSVEYDREADRVFLRFEVFDEKYKDFALRVAGRDNISLSFVGEKLEVQIDEPEEEL
jgi:hypothetical protein